MSTHFGIHDRINELSLRDKRALNGETRYDLKQRTYLFAKQVRDFVRRLPRTISNIEDVMQLVRASGCIGARYIEANESPGKNEFAMHAKLSRKEAKESAYWLWLVFTGDNQELEVIRRRLVAEANELTKIFGAIARKAER